MKLGVFTPVFGDLSFDAMIAKVRALETVQAVELGTGGWPAARSSRSRRARRRPGRAREYRSTHRGRRPDHQRAVVSRQPARIPIVRWPGATTRCSARPCGSPSSSRSRWSSPFPAARAIPTSAKHPNWVTHPWPPEFLEVLDWQWEKKVDAALARRGARSPRDHGVKVALEAHPGFRRLQRRHGAQAARRPRGQRVGRQLRSEPFLLAGRRRADGDPRARRRRSFTSTRRTSRSIGRTSP